MAKFDIKELNYITAGKTQNTFNIGYCYTDDGNIKTATPEDFGDLQTTTFFGNVSQYNTLSKTYGSNKLSFYNIGKKCIIHGLYDIKKLHLKSTTTKTSPTDYSDVKNIDLIVPQITGDAIGICQFENYAYGLLDMTTVGPIEARVNYNNTSDIQYNRKLSSNNIDTYLYPQPNDIVPGKNYTTYQQLIDDNQYLSNEIISTCFTPKTNLRNIQYNYFLEIPEGTDYNEYEEGFIQADQFLGKNHLNYLFDLEYSDQDAGHTELEYAVLNGNVQIDLQIVPTNHFVEIKFQNSSSSQSSVLFGTNKGKDYFEFQPASSGYQWGGKNTHHSSTMKPSSDVHILQYNHWNNSRVIIDGNVIGEDQQLYSSKTLYLGWCADIEDKYEGKIFYIKIYNKSTEQLVRNLIPVKKDNQVVFYDCVTETYFTSESTMSAGPERLLDHCREYCGINVCGQNLYAKYRSNVYYNKEASYITYFSTGASELNTIKMTEVDLNMHRSQYSYQHVDIIETITKWDESKQSGHKSSLFSLKLIDTGLNTSTINESVKEKLRQNIKNSMRHILDAVIPANTQLFEIYFEGK